MTQQLTLSDGRKLDFAVLGKSDANTIPLLWFHGTPGANLPTPGIVEACEKHGLSFVAFSRAGYGSSTRQKGRRVIDTISDAAELLKHLGHSQFFAGGWSGGGPYALASAAKLPGCVAAVSIAGVAPYDAEGLDFLAGQGEDNVEEFHAALRGEEELQAFARPRRAEMLDITAASFVELLSGILPDVDQKALLEHQELGQYTVETMAEALKVSVDGWVDDDMAFIQPWGFDVKDIKIPVFLYQGALDAMVPFAHGKWLASHIPQATKHLEEKEGHVSIYLGRVEGMIKELVSTLSK